MVEQVTDLLIGNPTLKEVEEIGRKDKDYSYILNAVRTSVPHKLVSAESEAKKMGGSGTS